MQPLNPNPHHSVHGEQHPSEPTQASLAEFSVQSQQVNQSANTQEERGSVEFTIRLALLLLSHSTNSTPYMALLGDLKNGMPPQEVLQKLKTYASQDGIPLDLSHLTESPNLNSKLNLFMQMLEHTSAIPDEAKSGLMSQAKALMTSLSEEGAGASQDGSKTEQFDNILSQFNEQEFPGNLSLNYIYL